MIYIATVWIEHKHAPTEITERRLIIKERAGSPHEFRLNTEDYYRRHYEAGIYDITIGPVSESRLRQ